MIEQAFISGQLGKAVFQDGGRYFVVGVDITEPQECRPIDFSTFFGFGAEVTTLLPGKVDLVSLRRQLQTETKAHHALLLVISGMGSELDLETRSAVIEEAESFMQERHAHHFVRARLFSRPLLGSEDIVKARELAVGLNAPVTATLYQDVIEASEYIALVQEVWNETAYDYFLSFEDRATASQELTDLGAFADITSLILSKNFGALSSLVVTYAQKAELKGILCPGSLLLNDFRRRLVEKTDLSAERGTHQRRREREDAGEEDDVSVEAMLSRFKKGRDRRRSRIFTADEAKERVDHQIEAISKLIVQGNFNLANRYLTDLIGFHVRHSQREHLAMSLCSLAKVGIDARAFELAERMVNYALLLGIDDVVILNTQAQLLKQRGEFEPALAVYEETMTRFPNNEVVRGGYAEVLKATGEFDKALAVYEEAITQFPNNEVVRNGYAEVLKATGEFDKALAVYEEAMTRFPNNEVARDGYAEVLKATGEFDRALAVYDETMTRFPNNEVARSGYAEVLKARGEFDKALAVYEETMTRFPNNEVVRGGYAEVLKATGEFDKALAVYEEAMTRFPNNEVVRNGYAEVLKATGEFDEALAFYKETLTRFPNNRVSRSGYASVLVLLNRFEEVRSFLSFANPRSESDWIDYHIVAMSHLKEGNIDEATAMFSFGLENAPYTHQAYFVNALAVARIRKKDFEGVIRLLPTNVSNIDVIQRETRLALVGHSHAALGQRTEADQLISELREAKNPRVINLREAISRRYGLGQHAEIFLSTSEAYALDIKIEDQEFFLAEAA